MSRKGRAGFPGCLIGKGVIVAVIANEPGAERKESVLAGPVLMLQQPYWGCSWAIRIERRTTRRRLDYARVIVLIIASFGPLEL